MKTEVKEKLDISLSNHETGVLNLFRFIALTILVTFKSFVIRPTIIHKIFETNSSFHMK